MSASTEKGQPIKTIADILSGQAVLVTGAGRGIGRAIAISFAQQGCDVACVSRTQSEIESVVSFIQSTTTSKAKAFPFDISHISKIPGLVRDIQSWFGRPIDILVNNGGIARFEALECQIDMSHWEKVIATNLTSAVTFANEVLPSMLARQHGVILSVGSRAAVYDIPFSCSYSVSKAGLLRFHALLEVETRGQGVYNYYVQPGNIDTGILSTLGVVDPKAASHSGICLMLEKLNSCPKRAAEEVGNACIALARGEFHLLSGRYVDLDNDLYKQLEQFKHHDHELSHAREYKKAEE